MLRLCTVVAFLGGAALTGCASSSVPSSATGVAPGQRPAAPEPATPAVSYDWHPLILVPFGTLLKDVPLALHEVLLFNDAPHAARGTEDKDCYAIEGASPPPLLGRRPDDYLLCFEHDRLNRIEASVRLPAASAGSIFAAACAQWRGSGVPAAPTTTDICEGRDSATDFRARLGVGDSEQSAPEQSMMTMTISLVVAAP